MPWVRIDDHFDEHPKLAGVGPLGWAMWLAGLAYSNRNLTDGFIPWSKAGMLVSWDYLDSTGPSRVYVGGPDTVSEEGAVTSEYVITLLCEAGIWDRVKGGYRIHDYDKYQPTKAQIDADRAAKSAAGQAGGIAAARARAIPSAKADGTADAAAQSKPVPVPVPSFPTLSSAREGLPNVTPDAIEALEERTGRPVQIAGDKQLTEYDRLIADHGLEAVCAAMDSLREGKTLTARQLVWGAMKVLEPMLSPRIAADAEHAEEVERNSRRGVDATQRYLAELRAVGAPKGAA